jgi:hypothetical protein
MLQFLAVLSAALGSYRTGAAQWYLDTPTPAETQSRDAPYMELQQQITARLCKQDWNVSDNPFLFLKDHGDKQVVVRGKSVYGFSLTRWGDQCGITVDKNSALYKANLQRQRTATSQLTDITKAGYAILQVAAKNNYHLTAAQQKTVDSLKLEREKANARLNSLSHAQDIAWVNIDINANWMDEKNMQGFAADKAVRLTALPGVQQAVLFVEYPDQDDPDTSYRAWLYIGKWPRSSFDKMTPFSFRYHTKYAWTDKEHSGPPLIENLKVLVYGYRYNQVMKVVHALDWTRLLAWVKE